MLVIVTIIAGKKWSTRGAFVGFILLWSESFFLFEDNPKTIGI